MIACWNCGATVDRGRLTIESIVHGRPRAEGGPYRSWRCPACRAENGVLASPAGALLLYPLGGLRPIGLLDRLLSRDEFRRLEAASRWWGRHLADVERFRRGDADRARAEPREEPPPPPRRSAPRTPPRRAAASTGPRAVLGVPDDATPDEIRRAFRRLAKRHHPDRAGDDPAAGRRFREIREAYEELTRG